MIKRLENSTGKAKKAKNRYSIPHCVKLHGAPPLNLQFWKTMHGGLPHLSPWDLPCMVVFHATRHAKCHRRRLPHGPPCFFFAKFFWAFMGRNQNLILNLEILLKNYKWLFHIKNCFSNFWDKDKTDKRRTRPSQGLGTDSCATLDKSSLIRIEKKCQNW